MEEKHLSSLNIAENYISVIAKAKLFSDIDTAEIKSMLVCLQPNIKSISKNDFIAVEGSDFSSIGIILKGSAIISKENAAGSRVVIASVGPGEMFGEMAVFAEEKKWPSTVQASEACLVFFLDREKIIGQCGFACTWHKELISNMLRIVSSRALMLNKQVEYLAIKGMREKIATFFLEQYKKQGAASFMLPMKRQELADFLNVSRPSMSREMCKMRDEGIIDFHLSAVKIKDIKALKSIPGSK